MEKRENHHTLDVPRKKFIKRNRPSFALKKKSHRRLKHTDLRRIAAEVVDS